MAGFCMLESCDRLAYAKGYCKRHYMHILRHGQVMSEHSEEQRKRCEAPKCVAFADSGGYCRKHGRQLKIHGELRPDREYMTGKKACSEEGCDRKVRARGLCSMHYLRRYRDGTTP